MDICVVCHVQITIFVYPLRLCEIKHCSFTNQDKVLIYNLIQSTITVPVLEHTLVLEQPLFLRAHEHIYFMECALSQNVLLPLLMVHFVTRMYYYYYYYYYYYSPG